MSPECNLHQGLKVDYLIKGYNKLVKYSLPWPRSVLIGTPWAHKGHSASDQDQYTALQSA